MISSHLQQPIMKYIYCFLAWPAVKYENYSNWPYFYIYSTLRPGQLDLTIVIVQSRLSIRIIGPQKWNERTLVTLLPYSMTSLKLYFTHTQQQKLRFDAWKEIFRTPSISLLFIYTNFHSLTSPQNIFYPLLYPPYYSNVYSSS